MRRGVAGRRERNWRTDMLLGLTLIAARALLYSVMSSAAAATLPVSAGKRVITPAPLLPVSGGLGPPRPAREKRGELTARALYLRRGPVSVAIVSLDLLGFPAVLAARVRARVPRLKPENIVI